MKTGMAIFTRADTMAERGFIDPFLGLLESKPDLTLNQPVFHDQSRDSGKMAGVAGNQN